MSDDSYLAGLMDLSGKVALVTGGRLGIGAAAAQALVRAGARVVVTSRDIRTLAATLEQMGAPTSSVTPLALDVRDPDQVEDAVAHVAAEFGRLDILINNAAVSTRSPAIEVTQDQWDEVFDTNLKGAFFVAQAAAKQMRRSNGGRIINLSSTFAKSVLPGRSVYACTKAALEHLTRYLAAEWAEWGVTVNCIAPTTILTETRAHLFPTEESKARRISEIPLGRLSVTEDIVPAILFLAGRAGAFVTGHTLYVDGGFTLR